MVACSAPQLEKARAKHVKEMKNEKAKQAKPVLMEELRALGQVRISPNDQPVRIANPLSHQGQVH